MCLDMDIVFMKLQLGAIDDAKVLLEEGKEKLPKITSSESVVFSKYYRAAAEYRKVNYYD